MLTLRSIVLSTLLGLIALSTTACKPDYPNCETDEHCAEQNQVCVGQICRMCRDDQQCSIPGQICSGENTCVYRLGYCDADQPCPGSQKCRSNECGPQCLDNSECGGNEFCDEGSCTTKPECGPNADRAECDEGYECVSGRCSLSLVECNLNSPVYFDFAKARIKRSQSSKLEEVSACLKGRSVANTTVGGHADEIGDAAFNLALGEERAQTVRDYLVRLGVPSSILRVLSYGENKLAVDAPGRQPKNRRVEFEH